MNKYFSFPKKLRLIIAMAIALVSLAFGNTSLMFAAESQDVLIDNCNKNKTKDTCKTVNRCTWCSFVQPMGKCISRQLPCLYLEDP